MIQRILNIAIASLGGLFYKLGRGYALKKSRLASYTRAHAHNTVRAPEQLEKSNSKRAFGFIEQIARNMLKRKLLLLSSIVLIILLPIVFFTLQSVKKTEAAWFNDNWQFRQTVTLSNTGSAQTNYQVSFTLDTASLVTDGKILSSCNDIRVTDINGKVLPYWVDTQFGCNVATTRIWTKVPLLPAGNSVILVYYGNPRAAVNSNRAAVMEAQDSFETGAIGLDWNQALGTWTAVSGSDGYYANTNQDWAVLRYTNTSPTDSVQILKTNTQTEANGLDAGLFARYQDINNYYRVEVTNKSDSHLVWIIERSGGIDSTLTSQAIDLTDSMDIAIKFTVQGTTISAQVLQYSDDTVLVDLTTTDASFTSGPIGLWSNRGAAFGDIEHPLYDWYVYKAIQIPPTSSVANEENGPGPVGYWKFDEGYGPSAYDSTLNANTAALATGISAPVWQTEDQCMSGRCLKFSGTTQGQYLNAGNPTALNFAGTNPFTISVWVRPGTATMSGDIISKFDSGVVGQYYLSLSSGKVVFHREVSPYTVTGNTTLLPDRWYHIEAVYDGTNIQIFVNGYADSAAQASGSVSADTTNVLIGANYTSSVVSSFFTGTIDELKIYKYGRSAIQIKADYVAGTSHAGAIKGVNSALGGPPDLQKQFDKGFADYPALSQGFVAYWKMDESSWSGASDEIIDYSGNAHHGTAVNGVTTNLGYHGRAGDFDGASGRITLSSPTTILPTGATAVTFAGWIYPNAVSGQKTVYYFDNGSAQATVLQLNGDGEIVVINSCSWNSFASGHWRANEWQHFAITYEGTMIRLYRNGVFLQGQACTAALPVETSAQIGQQGTNSTRIFNGKIDEIRIYDHALTTSEVAILAERTGPLAYYNFDEGAGTTAADSSGFTNPASWAGTGDKWTTGKFGKAALLNGTDDTVSASDQTGTNDISRIQDFTVGFWVKDAGVNASQDAIVEKWAGSGGYPFVFRYNSSNSIHFARYDGTNNPAIQGTKAINDGLWHYISGTRTGATMALYIDGVNVGTTNDTTTGTTTNSSRLYVGSRGGSTFWYNGSVDELKIYGYSRSAAQIIEDMNGGHPVGGSPIGSQIGYYKFDQSYGNTANDSSPLVNNAVLRGMTQPTTGWTTAGKFNSGILLDGFNDYVEVPDNSALQYRGNDLSISTWVKLDSSDSDGGWIWSKAWNGSGQYNYNLLYNTDTTVTFSLYGSVPASYALQTTAKLTPDIWHYVAVTINGTSKTVKIYFDGIMVTQGTHSITDYNPTTATENLQLALGTLFPYGEFDGTGITQFSIKGTIDEAKVYNSLLTDSDVKIDYNRGSAIVLGVTSTDAGGSYPDSSAAQEFCVPGDTASCSQPLADWAFNEGSGTDVNDISGNSHPATWNGTGTTHWAPGKSGRAGYFNGTDDYVNLGNSSDINIGDNAAFTLQAWVKTFDSSGPIVSLRSDTSSNPIVELAVGYNGATNAAGRAVILIREDDSSGADYAQLGGATVNDGKWHMVTLTRSSGSTVALFVDGLLIGRTSSAGSNGTISTGGGLRNVGREGRWVQDAFGTTAQQFLNGSIDQVRFYNYERTVGQIAIDYNHGAPSYWLRFDEGQGTFVYDSSGRGLTAPLNIAATGSQTAPGSSLVADTTTAWYNGRTGVQNGALKFDGTDDEIETGNTTIFGTAGASYPQISMAYWLNPTVSTGGTSYMLLKANEFRLGWNSTTPHPTCSISTAGGFVTLTSTRTTFGTNRWYHLACTYDGVNLRIYVNGQLDAIGAQTGLVIGRSSVFSVGSGTAFYNGYLDDIRIYSYRLTDQQIKTVYAFGAANFAPLTGSP